MQMRARPCGSLDLMRLRPSPRISRRCMSIKNESVLTSDALNSYAVSAPPSPIDVDRANRFFIRGPTKFLFSAGQLSQIPPTSSTPEIALLGRSNVGKSSLLNALLNKKNAKLAHESKNPGRTRTLNFFGVGGAAQGEVGTKRVAKKGMSIELLEKSGKGKKDVKKGSEIRNTIGQGGLVVVDCPGYGFGSRDEWGEVVIRYLQKREQLVRAYLLVDISVGLKKSDAQTLDILREAGTPHQIVLSKVDKLLFPSGHLGIDMEQLPRRLKNLRKWQDDFKEDVMKTHAATSLCTDLLCVSSNDRALGKYKRIGIEELQHAVLDAAGLLDQGKEIDKYEKQKQQDEHHGVIGWDQLEQLSPTASHTRAPAR